MAPKIAGLIGHSEAHRDSDGETSESGNTDAPDGGDGETEGDGDGDGASAGVGRGMDASDGTAVEASHDEGMDACDGDSVASGELSVLMMEDLSRAAALRARARRGASAGSATEASSKTGGGPGDEAGGIGRSHAGSGTARKRGASQHNAARASDVEERDAGAPCDAGGTGSEPFARSAARRPVAREAGRGDDQELREIAPLKVAELGAYIGLQNMFIEEHYELTREMYPTVTLDDWYRMFVPQATLAAREEHTAAMISGDHPSYRGLTMLRVRAASGALAGYIMYEKVGVLSQPKGKRKRADAVAVPARDAGDCFTLIRQFFVQRELRGLGHGRALLHAMLQALGSSEHGRDVRLSVSELNSIRPWYRRLGFRTQSLTTTFVGCREEGNLIVFEDMRWFRGTTQPETQDAPQLFNSNVLDEVLTVTYPDGSGTYRLRVMGYNRERNWHSCDSSNLSTWLGGSFTDLLDLNEYYMNGHAVFDRPLCLAFREQHFARRKKREETRRVARLCKTTCKPLVVKSDDSALGPILEGVYQFYTKNGGRPVYRKDLAGDAGGREVLIYFWEKLRGPLKCGWYFGGPKTSADPVWAFHPSVDDRPPSADWRQSHRTNARRDLDVCLAT